MEGYLVKTTEVWRVADNEAADAMEETFRVNELFDLTVFNKANKNKKEKGEIVEEWVQVTATKVFNDMRAPESDVRPEYK